MVPYPRASSRGQVCSNALPPARQRSSYAGRDASTIAPHALHKDACNLSSTCCHTLSTWPWLLAALSHLSTAVAYWQLTFMAPRVPGVPLFVTLLLLRYPPPEIRR